MATRAEEKEQRRQERIAREEAIRESQEMQRPFRVLVELEDGSQLEVLDEGFFATAGRVTDFLAPLAQGQVKQISISMGEIS